MLYNHNGPKKKAKNENSEKFKSEENNNSNLVKQVEEGKSHRLRIISSGFMLF